MKLFSQRRVAFILLILSMTAGLLLYTYSHSLMYYWIFGLSFGCILQHSHLCFVSAASDPFLSKSTDQYRAILIGILISSLGISAIKYLSNGVYDTLGVSAVSAPLIFGAFIFGVGMEIAGCCCSGMFIRLGEGYSIHLITFLSVILGYCFANTHYNTLWAPFVQKSPSVFLPHKLGWVMGVGLNIAILLFFYIMALKRDRLSASNENTSYLKGAVCLGILCVLHIVVLKTPWSVSGAFYWIENCTKSIFNGRLKTLLDCKDSITIAVGTNIRNLGLLIGAMISILFSSQFNLRRIQSRQQVIKSILGGFLMGYGVCIAGGCNITSFFVAASSMSLSGWVFMISLFAGAFVGIKLLFKFV